MGPAALIRPEAVPDLLFRLVDRSLVVTELTDGDSDRSARYRLLETLHQYAHEQLTDGDEREALRQRHAAYFAALAAGAAGEIFGPAQAAWLTRLEQDHENLRAALQWLAVHGDAEEGLRLGAALAPFWQMRAYFAEGREWLTRLAARPGAGPTPARAVALVELSRLDWSLGDYAAQRVHDEESLDIFRQLGDRRGVATSLSDLAATAFQEGRYATARALLEESLVLCEQLGDRPIQALSLMRLASVTRDQGDFAGAHRFYDHALAIRRELGDQSGIAHVLSNMGWLALYADQHVSAQALQEESLAIRRQLGERREVAVSFTVLGRVAFARGRPAEARTLYAESLRVHAELGNDWGVAIALEGLAELVAQDQPERALRLGGAAHAVRTSIGRPLPPVEQPFHRRWREAAAGGLGEEAAGAAWQQGQATTKAQSVAVALLGLV